MGSLSGPWLPQAFHRALSFQEWLPKAFVKRISQLDTQSPVTKINGKRWLIASAFDSICGGISKSGKPSHSPLPALTPSLSSLTSGPLPGQAGCHYRGRTLQGWGPNLTFWLLSGCGQVAKLQCGPQCPQGPDTATSSVFHPPEL